MYVPFSFCSARHSSTRRGSSWVSASSSRTSTAVETARVRPVRFRTGSCSLSNRMSASCFGELILNSTPGQLVDSPAEASCSSRSIRCDCAASAGPSTRMPARSMPDEDGHERHLEIRVDPRQAFPLDGGLQRVGQLQREVRPLARVGEGGGERQRPERGRLGASPADVLFADRLVAEVLERRVFQPVLRPRRVEQVAGEHRVERETAERDALSGQHNRVRLEVVPDLAEALVLEQRPDGVQHVAQAQPRLAEQRALLQGHVPRAPRGRREREPDDAGADRRGGVGQHAQTRREALREDRSTSAARPVSVVTPS